MLNWLSNFQLEKISFFLGFLSATIIWIALSKAKTWYPAIRKFLQTYFSNLRRYKSFGIHDAIIKEAYQRAQSNHLAKNLFYLDEILIEPELLVHSNEFNDESQIFGNAVASVVPFIPEFPFLCRNYNVPRITISEAIQSNANIAICGMSGSGKSVTLAHLVSQLVKNDPACGKHSQKIPFYLDIHDIELGRQFDIVELIYNALAPKIPGNLNDKLTKFIRSEIETNNCVLIIDGLDELHPENFDQFTHHINKIIEGNPNLQIITTVSPIYFGYLLQIGFSPLFISAWSNFQINEFYSKWNSNWNSHVQSNQVNLNFPNSKQLLFNWISTEVRPMSPLEYTLYIWGSFGGDITGSGFMELVSAYVNRVLPDRDNQMKLSILAQDCIENKSLHFIPDEIKHEDIEKFIQSGLIIETSQKKLIFSHTEVIGYLANLNSTDHISELSGINLHWPVEFSNFGFRASGISEIDFHQFDFIKNKSPFHFNLFLLGYLLRYSGQNLTWRNKLIKNFVGIVQDRKINFSIRLRAIAALILSNESNLPVFFRQLLNQEDENYKKLALYSLGCIKQDYSFINDIISISKNDSVSLQEVSCLVLSTYETENTIHELARYLLSAEEKVRQLIAESLAFNNPKGEEIIKEATTMDDIVVRRSSIYGLTKINNLWAIQTLKKMVIEDSQWVVRNAATQALEYLESNSLFIPKRTSDVHEDPWIKEFAGKQNLGVSPEQSVTRILLLALSSENKNDVINAVSLSLFDNNKETITRLNELVYSFNDQRMISHILFILFLINNSRIK